MKGYKLWDPKNKKIVWSKYVTFSETSQLKSTISQQVERLNTKDVSQRVEVDTTPPFTVGSLSVGISPDMTLGRDHNAAMDTEQVELFAAKGTKLNPQKQVKKRESQNGELDKLKLKVIVLHDGIDKEAHMIRPVGLVAACSISVG